MHVLDPRVHRMDVVMDVMYILTVTDIHTDTGVKYIYSQNVSLHL
jgi:hypothetical protein